MPILSRRLVAVPFAGMLAALVTAGCGGGEKVFPVEGTVTIGTEPLKTGSIAFHPDAEKGNKGGQPAIGTIENGKYRLGYQGKDGALVGAYKVTVTASVPSNPKDEYSVSKPLVATTFSQPATTPLTAEVKEGG